MKQKTALAGALIHDPKLLILDEPLTGLDAGTSRQVKDVLTERVRAGADGDPDHPHPGGRRTHGRPHRHNSARPPDRAGHAGRASGPGGRARRNTGGYLPRTDRDPAMILRAGSTVWLLAHEIRLARRALTARPGMKWRVPVLIVAFIVAALAIGVPAAIAIRAVGFRPSPLIVAITAVGAGAVFILMLSQCLASATRDALRARRSRPSVFLADFAARGAVRQVRRHRDECLPRVRAARHGRPSCRSP